MLKICKIAIVVVVFLCLYFFLFHPSATFERLDRLQIKLSSIKNNVLILFFDVFGYPEDVKMASADELFQAINTYRNQQNFLPLEKKETLCIMAKNKLNTLPTIVHTNKYELISDLDDEGEATHQGKEIIQVFPQRVSAESIINRFWLRPFSQQKEVIENPIWRYGCGAITELQLVFIFSQ